MHSRRAILRTTALAAPALALAACTGQTATQLQTDVTLIANGLSGVVASLQAQTAFPVPATVLMQAEATLDSIRSNASVIAGALTPSASAVQNVAQGVQVLSALLQPYFPAAPSLAAVVQAALALVPVILASVGVSAASIAVSMPPDAARAVLHSAAH